MQGSPATAFRQKLESLYSISIEIARRHEMHLVLDRALGFCLDLTQSAFGFIGLLVSDGRDGTWPRSRDSSPRPHPRRDPTICA
ncbi:MAG: hypothetical protein ACYDAL_07955 [Candidatus Dormibacteraceae bacterium]